MLGIIGYHQVIASYAFMWTVFYLRCQQLFTWGEGYKFVLFKMGIFVYFRDLS